MILVLFIAMPISGLCIVPFVLKCTEVIQIRGVCVCVCMCEITDVFKTEGSLQC